MSSVDVVVPNYNYGRYLKECVDAVLAQNIDNVRVLIVDNASTDNSREVAQELALGDRRVELRLRNKNLGHHASFNEGIDWAASDYFLILGADDCLTAGALGRAAGVMDEHPDVHLTSGQVIRIPQDGRSWQLDNDNCSWRLVDGLAQLKQLCATGWNLFHGPTVVVRTEVQKRVGYYSRELTNTDDFEMWMRFTGCGRVAETTAYQAFARYGDVSRSAHVLAWRLQYEAAFRHFFEHQGHSLPGSAELGSLWRKTLGAHAYWSVAAQIRRGEIRGAMEQLKLVCRLSPSMLLIPPVGHFAERLRAKDLQSSY